MSFERLLTNLSLFFLNRIPACYQADEKIIRHWKKHRALHPDISKMTENQVYEVLEVVPNDTPEMKELRYFLSGYAHA